MAADRQLGEQIRELNDTVRRITGQSGQAARLKVVQLEQRISDLERSRSSNSGSFEPPAGVLLALGSAHFRNGHRDEAEHHWSEATQANPRLGEAWNNLAVVYLRTARKAEATNAVERAGRAGSRVHQKLKDDISRMPGR